MAFGVENGWVQPEAKCNEVCYVRSKGREKPPLGE
jgi:hypothetical protein